MTGTLGETRLAAGALLRGDALAGPHLFVASGPEAGRRIPLRPSQTLGRGPGADLRLDDPCASRLHVRLVLGRGGCVAEDLGSKNGVRVNGRLRGGRRRRLAVGDELTVGETRLVLTTGLLDAVAREAPRSAAPAPSPGEPRAGRPGRIAAASLAAAAALLAGASLLLALP